MVKLEKKKRAPGAEEEEVQVERRTIRIHILTRDINNTWRGIRRREELRASVAAIGPVVASNTLLSSEVSPSFLTNPCY